MTQGKPIGWATRRELSGLSARAKGLDAILVAAAQMGAFSLAHTK